MTPRIIEVRHLADYVLFLRFADGTAGQIDLAEELWGEVFEPLKDLERFREVGLHPELGALVWPNGADFAPEFIYRQVRVAA